MLSLEDCIGLCGLTEEEVLAITRREHLPAIVAAELGCYLLRTPDGELRIKRILKQDLEAAAAGGDRERVLALKLALRDFICRHPACDERTRAALRYQPERRQA